MWSMLYFLIWPAELEKNIIIVRKYWKSCILLKNIENKKSESFQEPNTVGLLRQDKRIKNIWRDMIYLFSQIMWVTKNSIHLFLLGPPCHILMLSAATQSKSYFLTPVLKKLWYCHFYVMNCCMQQSGFHESNLAAYYALSPSPVTCSVTNYQQTKTQYLLVTEVKWNQENLGKRHDT